MSDKRILFLVFTILLVACVPVTLTATPASTVRPVSPTPPEPTPTTIIVSPTARIERWKEYEDALAAVFLPLPALSGKGLCEWELLGQAQDQIYVWAMCQVDAAEGAAMSAPAIIDLGADGTITKVEVPKDGSAYGASIRQIFPTELQEKILAQSVDTQVMWTHLQARHTTPEVPLIVTAGVVLP